ncbi:hypothetical protein AA21291_0550 [Swaminathania salitolerans LMG 21291]|uniref:Uncharacterized protein n=1 Tax=Swaminathania salitolerans TaxID=182838 RepID=A0A511BVV6_9PROT|nr:hypothetical protein AA21291_0550 [Swaminathania salitolerans LMG 21291]GEL02158.1 hypothetical protein SSA02_13210 [Swaminathania salitolerans]
MTLKLLRTVLRPMLPERIRTGLLEAPPDQSRHQSGCHAENDPTLLCIEPETGQARNRQTRECDPESHSGKHDASLAGPAHRLQPRETPARRMDQNDRTDDTADKTQSDPDDHVVHCHRKGQQTGRYEAPTDDRRTGPMAGKPHAEHRAEQISDIIGTGERTSAMKTQAAIAYHDRHEWRKSEASDTHRHGERDDARRQHGTPVPRLVRSYLVRAFLIWPRHDEAGDAK